MLWPHFAYIQSVGLDTAFVLALQVTGLDVPKLVPNLQDKERYVLHYRNLQLYIKLGRTLGKVHRVLAFHQEPWMKPYIMKNTELKKLATGDFEKNFYKVNNISNDLDLHIEVM